MDDIDVKLGQLIKAKRKERRLTQTQLAEKVGSTTQVIYYYEKGKRSMSAGFFFKLCEALDLDPNEIQKQLS